MTFDDIKKQTEIELRNILGKFAKKGNSHDSGVDSMLNFAKVWASRTFKILLVLVLLIFVIRAALPHVILYFANKKLNEVPGYSGYLTDVDLHLIRGVVELEGLEVQKSNGKVPVPFFSMASFETTIDWRALFKGTLAAEIRIREPKLNLVAGPTKESSQTVDTRWQDKIKELVPIQINTIRIMDAEVHFRNFQSKPPVDLFAHNINVVVSNLTNSEKLYDTLAATLKAKGNILGNGQFGVNIRMNPFAEQPTFDLDMSVDRLNLVKMNDFIKAYGKFDVEKGTFGLYGEFAAKNGAFEGYLKPIFNDLEVFKFEEKEPNPLKYIWEAIVGTVAEIFENQPKDRIASRVPFAGRFDNPDIDVWESVWQLIKNAFIKALIPGIEQRVTLKQVGDKK